VAPYKERFPEGTAVRVASRSTLKQQREWKNHHPITDEHLEYAGAASRVTSVGFYHGGDALYVLEGMPQLQWHEFSLEACA
jgi:hypothetical protein